MNTGPLAVLRGKAKRSFLNDPSFGKRNATKAAAVNQVKLNAAEAAATKGPLNSSGLPVPPKSSSWWPFGGSRRKQRKSRKQCKSRKQRKSRKQCKSRKQ